jgi:hypothetical protein
MAKSAGKKDGKGTANQKAKKTPGKGRLKQLDVLEVRSVAVKGGATRGKIGPH